MHQVWFLMRRVRLLTSFHTHTIWYDQQIKPCVANWQQTERCFAARCQRALPLAPRSDRTRDRHRATEPTDQRAPPSPVN